MAKFLKKPSPEVVKYLINPAIKQDLERSYQTILDINKAHVIMLVEEGIITREVGSKDSLPALKKLQNARESGF